MDTQQPNKQVRNRTRTAILRTAINLLASGKQVPLTEISKEAGVARSTLHRYFPDRDSLITSIEEYAEETYDEAATRARIDEGTALEAFDRLIWELLERIDIFAWWINNDDLNEDSGESSSPADQKILDLLTRGRRDGTMSSDLEPRWILSSIWALILAVFMERRSGSLTERELRKLCHGSLMKLVS